MTRPRGRCPTCAGQGDIILTAYHHRIEDRPANGRADSWPCPTCGGRGRIDTPRRVRSS